MKRNIFSRIRKMAAGMAAGALALIWWAVLYPELCFPQDTYDVIYDETKTEEVCEEELFRQLMKAGGEEIVIESRLWEWMKKRSLSVK
ncbi:MAG: stage II sporulation protein R [Bacillus sp. (in: Bacteria)]|nr:stage II sporulation protein R [Bacillus sp. (in: firmicutes)]MCM1426196.1 stage II sporulation protein R [Eubacterium sp.]